MATPDGNLLGVIPKPSFPEAYEDSLGSSWKGSVQKTSPMRIAVEPSLTPKLSVACNVLQEHEDLQNAKESTDDHCYWHDDFNGYTGPQGAIHASYFHA